MDDVVIWQGVEVGRRIGAVIVWHPSTPEHIRLLLQGRPPAAAQ